MKKLFSLILISFTLFSYSVLAQSKVKIDSSPGKERIEVVFKNTYSLEDLVKIKNDLNEKGISIEYKLLKFDKNSQLVAINFEVNCNDGFKGAGKIDGIEDNANFGFFRDYSKDAESPFGTGDI